MPESYSHLDVSSRYRTLQVSPWVAANGAALSRFTLSPSSNYDIASVLSKEPSCGHGQCSFVILLRIE